MDAMPFDSAAPQAGAIVHRDRRLVAGWLFALCAMTLVMVSLGGATQGFTIEAGNNVRIEQGVTVSAGSVISLSASSSSIEGGGRTTTGTVTVLGNLISRGSASTSGGAQSGIVLQAGTGGIALNGTLSVDPTFGSEITLNTPGPVTQTAGALVTPTLTGSTGTTSLLSPTNAISRVFNYVASGSGGFALANSVDLTVTRLSVPANSTVSFTQTALPTARPATNALTINSIRTLAEGSAPINLVLSAPAGVEVTSGTKTAGLLSVTRGDLANAIEGVSNNTLTLRSQAGAGAGGTVTLGKPGDPAFDFSLVSNSSSVGGAAGYTRLTLDANGLVSQNAPITVDRVTGQAGTLDLRANNAVQELAGFTTTGNLAFRTGENPLLISGPVVAGGGAADVNLSSGGTLNENMTLAADVRGASVLLNVSNNSEDGTIGGILQTAGVVTATTLEPRGGFVTLNGQNRVTSLGNATTLRGLSLTNAQALGITGVVENTSGTVALTAPSILQSPTSSITTPTLASTSPSAAFDSPTNSVATVGTVNAQGGTFSLTNSVPLTIGTFNANGGQVTLVADRVASQNGSVSVRGGSLRFAPLTPSRRIELVNGSEADPNSLSLSQSLLNRLDTGTLILGDTRVSGVINVGNAGETITLSNIDGTLRNTLQLQTTGAVTQGAGAALAVENLVGASGSLALGGDNTISFLGRDAVPGTSALPGVLTGYATAGALTLTSNKSLDVSNVISARGLLSLRAGSSPAGGPPPVNGNLGINAALTAPDITLAYQGNLTQSGGTIAATGTLTLASVEGNVSNAIGGTISANTLTGQSRNVELTRATVANLGRFDARNFSLDSTGPLVVSGPVVADVALALNATGAITEAPAGLVAAQVLTGRADRVDLSGANRVAALGDFITSTGFTLNNQPSLAVTGVVRDGQSVSLRTDGSMTLSGTVAAPSTTLTATGVRETVQPPALAGSITQTAGSVTGSTVLTLTAAGAIEQSGGTVTAGRLIGGSGSTTALPGANAVDTLGAFRSTGGFTLGNGRNLAVAGPVNDAIRVSLNITGDLALQGDVITGSLVANAGVITQPSGTIRADRLSGGSSTGSASFDQPGNAITALGPFASTGDFSVTDSTAISVAGAVSAGTGRTLSVTADDVTFGAGGSLSAAGGTVRIAELSPAGLSITGGVAPPVTATTLVLGTPTGGPVQINGSLDLLNVSVLDLQSAGALTQSGGGIRVGTLTGNGASATLNGPNRISTLGRFGTTGALSLTNAESLAVTGPVSASAAALNVTGDLVLRSDISAPTMTLAATGGISQQSGIVSAPVRLTLSAGGAVTQTEGSIVTGLLDGRARSVNLPNRANEIATVGPFTSTGSFLLYNRRSLTVADTVDAEAVELEVAGDLRLDGSVIGGSVTLAANNTITEGPNGLVAASTLTGSADRADLSGANRVAVLSDFNTGTGFAFNNQTSLAVTGVVRDSRSVSLSTDGSLVLSGTIAAPVTSLTAAGATQQPGGAITTGTLSGSSGGATVLSSANAVTTLGAFRSAGGFTLENRRSLDVTGPVQDSTRVRLSVAGDLRLQGTLNTGTLSLNAEGAITQPGGTIQAQQLTGGATATSLDQPGNAISSLGQFNSLLDFSITDGRPLSVDSFLSGSIGRNISLTADTVALGAGGTLSAPGGTVRVAARTPAGLSITGNTGTVNAGTLVLGTPTGGPVAIFGTLALPGVSVLDLQSAGALTQAGGGIQVGTLTGSGASATLTGPNRIGTLGGFTTTGLLTLRSVDNLSVAGPVNAGTLALNAPNVTLSGAVTAGTFDVTASGQVAQGADTLTTGRLTGSSGQGVSLGEGGVANVTELGSFTAGGNFVLQNAQPLTITGTLEASQMSVSATGRLTLQGGAIATGPGSVLRVAGNAAEFVQTGTTTVLSLAGTTATLRLELATSGTMTLDNLQAASTDLTLSLGTGRATGALQAGSLLVVGSGGSANLTGSVAGQGGFAAAERSRISPRFDTGYLLNNCAIQSVSCVVRPVVPFSETALSSIIAPQRFLRPQAQGLDAITSPDSQRNDASRLPFLTFDRSTNRDRDDPSLLLPNISDRDY